jgi:hypothetical protein
MNSLEELMVPIFLSYVLTDGIPEPEDPARAFHHRVVDEFTVQLQGPDAFGLAFLEGRHHAAGIREFISGR